MVQHQFVMVQLHQHLIRLQAWLIAALVAIHGVQRVEHQQRQLQHQQQLTLQDWVLKQWVSC